MKMHEGFFLDDVRDCPDGYALARTYRDAIDMLSRNPRFEIWSLDHDLGGRKTGLDFLKWVMAVLPKHRLPDEILVHSANIVGSERMIQFGNEVLNIPTRRK
jgi:hypothetical protein